MAAHSLTTAELVWCLPRRSIHRRSRRADHQCGAEGGSPLAHRTTVPSSTLRPAAGAPQYPLGGCGAINAQPKGERASSRHFITASQISKSNGYVCREGIPHDQVVAVGDGANDLLMLSLAGMVSALSHNTTSAATTATTTTTTATAHPLPQHV